MSNTLLIHKLNAVRLAAAEHELQEVGFTVANREAWKEAKLAMLQTSAQLKIEWREFSSRVQNPELAAARQGELKINKRTRMLSCERCDVVIKLNGAYRLAWVDGDPVPYCLSCGRPESQVKPERIEVEFDFDGYLAAINEYTPPGRTGIMWADPQTSWDDLQESSVTAMRTLKHLDRTVHDPFTIDSRHITWEDGFRHATTVVGTVTNSELSAESINEIEDEPRPMIPDWTIDATFGPRLSEISQRRWRITRLDSEGRIAG